jgi:Leucine Rich repeat
MSDSTTTKSVPSSPKRSWRRFTLRALFLFVLVAGILFGWVAYRVRQFHDQAAFIADLRSRGFRVEVLPASNAWFWCALAGDDAVQARTAELRAVRTDSNDFTGPTSEDLRLIGALTSLKQLIISSEELNDHSIQQLMSLQELEYLQLDGASITDAGVSSLAVLTRLESLVLRNLSTPESDNTTFPEHFRLTDASIGSLSRLTRLRFLEIGQSGLTDNGVRLLCETFTDLNTLRLRAPAITNRALQHLGTLRHLVELNITGATQISDEGLPYLAGLRDIERLELFGTSVTPAAAQTFIDTMPRLGHTSDGWRNVLGKLDPFATNGTTPVSNTIPN